MRKLLKIALLLEVVLAFAMPIYFWLMGLIMSPLLIWQLFSLDGIGSSVPILIVILVIWGALGILGILQLAVKVLDPEFKLAFPQTLKIYIALGLAALVAAAFILDFGWTGFCIVFLPPILVSLHLMYLARSQLWVDRCKDGI
jgi:hypothetical protein